MDSLIDVEYTHAHILQKQNGFSIYKKICNAYVMLTLATLYDSKRHYKGRLSWRWKSLEKRQLI